MTIGDSLTQGMSSGAVFEMELSWLAIVAGSHDVDMPTPTYGDPLAGCRSTWSAARAALYRPSTCGANIGIYGCDVRDCLSYGDGVAAHLGPPFLTRLVSPAEAQSIGRGSTRTQL
jgi:hypothetical protein